MRVIGAKAAVKKIVIGILLSVCMISCARKPLPDGASIVYTYDPLGHAVEAKVYISNNILVSEATCYRLVKDDNLLITEIQYDKSGSGKIVYEGFTLFDKWGSHKLKEKAEKGSKQYNCFDRWPVNAENSFSQ